MFSGGTYDEVGRWLWNFLVSHAKREHPRIEVELEMGVDRDGASYGARLRLGDHRGPLLEFDYQDVADGRGRLAWCADMARRTCAAAASLGRAALETPTG